MVEEKNTLLRLPGETVRSVLGRHSLRTATPAKELLHAISRRKKVRLHPALPCFLGGLQRLAWGDQKPFRVIIPCSLCMPALWKKHGRRNFAQPCLTLGHRRLRNTLVGLLINSVFLMWRNIVPNVPGVT